MCFLWPALSLFTTIVCKEEKYATTKADMQQNSDPWNINAKYYQDQLTKCCSCILARSGEFWNLLAKSCKQSNAISVLEEEIE